MLNNKGFAISTMLYGMLTMIVLVLMLLLNIMQSNYNRTTEEVEDVSSYLDKCVSKQVALETCYKDYDSTTNSNRNSCEDEYEAYATCMGVSDSSIYANTINLGTLVSNLYNESGTSSGVYLDELETGGTRYVYRGQNVNNYVTIGNITGRIISVETNGTIKLLLTSSDYKLSSVKFDSEIGTTYTSPVQRFKNSTLYNEVQKKYNNIDYSSKFTTGKIYGGIIYSSDTTSDDVKIIDVLDRISSEYTEEYAGILSMYDIFNASNRTTTGFKCDLTSTSKLTYSNAVSYCITSSYNWITFENNNSKYYWTSTAYNDLDNYYVFNSNGSAATNNKGVSVTSSYDAMIVVFLKNTTLVKTDGDGSSSNPYVVQ